MGNEVFIVGCPDYNQAEEKIAELLTMMGGMGQFAAPGERIVLKVNLLQPTAPEKAVTTHPAVVAAVGRMAKKEGLGPSSLTAPAVDTGIAKSRWAGSIERAGWARPPKMPVSRLISTQLTRQFPSQAANW